MKHRNLFATLWTIAVAAALLMAALPTMMVAAGTTAGTTIGNQASVSFNDGSTVRVRSSNLLNLTVRQVVAGTFTGGTTSAGLDNKTVYFPVIFTNTGNQFDYYGVTFGAMPAGFTNPRLIEDTDSSLTLNGSEVSIPAGGTTTQVIVDTYRHFLIAVDVSNVPANLSANAIALTLTSKSAVGGSWPTLGATAPMNAGRTYSFTWTYTVNKPVLTWSVTQTNPSPAIPGQTGGSWVVTYDNTGNADMLAPTNITIAVPAGLQVSGPVSGTHSETAVYTPTLGTPASYGGSILVKIPATALTVAGGAYSFSIPFVIEQVSANGTGPASPGTVTTAAADFVAKFSGQAAEDVYTAPAPSPATGVGAIAVAASKGVKWSTFVATQSAGPDETIEAVLQIRNMGNTTADFDLAQADGAGTANVAHIYSMTSQGGSVTTTAPALAAGATQTIYVRVTTPAGFVSGNTIKRILTVTSKAAGDDAIGLDAVDYTQTITTNWAGSTLAIALTSDNANPLPGDVVEFTLTLTNSIATMATNVVIALPINGNMTFNTAAYGTFDFNVDGTNGNDGGAVTYAASTVSTSSAFSVPGNGTRVVKYRCTIK